MTKIEIYKRVLPEIGPIIYRNIFLLVNFVLGAVVILLFIFGNAQSGLFIGIILAINTGIAVAQDVRARLELEKLHVLTAATVTRLNSDGTDERILAESVKQGDRLKLTLGDQLPCDGRLVSADYLEVSEALITGESDSLAKEAGTILTAGTIITSGSGICEMQTDFSASSLSLLTKEMKRSSANPSSIQRDTAIFIQYSGYALVAGVVFVLLRGLYLHVPSASVVLNIGALASMFVPQGLLVVITLLFAIGAASYARRSVLFQEINSTEKLGRIKNLCMDKTGTLTDTAFNVNQMYVGTGISREYAGELVSLYTQSSGDLSETAAAIKRYVTPAPEVPAYQVTDTLSFSSWRKYGGIRVIGTDWSGVILVGTLNIFLPQMQSDEEQRQLMELLHQHDGTGERMLCAVRAVLPRIPTDLSENISGTRATPKSGEFSLLALFVFNTAFRAGAEKAVAFFQGRGIRIRVLSGDRAETVSAVALKAGINNANHVITGKEMASWPEKDFDAQADNYNVFAQIMPEQKVRLIESFRRNGFTAMIGDGVNDALAIKKADLGIAMFDGVAVTRQLSDVILMNNSFTDLPGAVILADNFIHSIELSAGIYITKSISGFLLFVFLSLFGFAFPLSPLNITFMNYFIVGIPGALIMYWAIWPKGPVAPGTDKTFAARIMPFVVLSGVVEAITMTIIFMLSPSYLQNSGSNTLVMLGIVFSSFAFLLLAPRAFGDPLTRRENLQVVALSLTEIVVIAFLLQIPAVTTFFNITLPLPDVSFIIMTAGIVAISGLIQYLIVQKLFRTPRSLLGPTQVRGRRTGQR